MVPPAPPPPPPPAGDIDLGDDNVWAPETPQPVYRGARGGTKPRGAAGSSAGGTGAARRVRSAFSSAAVDAVYYGGPRIEGYVLPAHLADPGVFPVPLRPTGDTRFSEEFGGGGRNAIDAEILYMSCAWLQALNNTFSAWETAAVSHPPTLSSSIGMHATARTHVYQVYNMLSTRYEVLLRWQSDASYAAAMHSAILDDAGSHFTKAATLGFHELAARDRATHVACDQSRVLARVPPGGPSANLAADAGGGRGHDWRRGDGRGIVLPNRGSGRGRGRDHRKRRRGAPAKRRRESRRQPPDEAGYYPRGAPPGPKVPPSLLGGGAAPSVLPARGVSAAGKPGSATEAFVAPAPPRHLVHNQSADPGLPPVGVYRTPRTRGIPLQGGADRGDLCP